MPWKVMATGAMISSLLLTTACSSETKEKAAKKAPYSAKVSDYTYDNAGNMFAYAEFELSGEPLAEGLGLNLDVLDSKKVNEPTKFDYTAGIESYEYSEEAMYEVTEKSGLGLHMLTAPTVVNAAKQAGKEPAAYLGERFYQLADAVGFKREEIFRNMFPTFIEYAYGDPHYIGKVDTEQYAANDDGTYVPVYQVDFASLRWGRDKMSRTLTPASYGATFLKQALWAGDFLGGLHTVDKDEELEAKTATDDRDANIRLGVSSADGMQGAFLTEMMIHKLAYVRDQLFLDGKTGQLTAGIGVNYNPANGLVYLPHEVTVEEDGNEQAPGVKALAVTDKRSVLQDQWLTLWPAAEFFGMTDQRPANKAQNPAFLAAFDGAPFAKAPQENVDANPNNDVRGTDAYSMNRDVLLHVFKNIDAMHFNPKMGAFVAEHDGTKQGDVVDTFEAGYTIEALRMFQRAYDGLPVGYASGDDAAGLGTAEGKRALELIRAQADFIMNKLTTKDGLVANSYSVTDGISLEKPTLKAQLGAIRGLTAAFLATKDEKYRTAARDLYEAMDKAFYNKSLKVYATKADEFKYDAFTAGALSAVYRIGLQNLANGNGEKTLKSLTKATIIERFNDFYERVIDGPGRNEGMQASEFWDTGDFYKQKGNRGNTDGDNVPQVQAGHGKYGIAPVLVPVQLKKN